MNGNESRCLIVIPCFNERDRLRREEFPSLLACELIDVLFVDDGSQDGTGQVLRGIIAGHEGRADLLPLAVNRGKGEAIRRGLRQGLEQGYQWVGYADADLATPPAEVIRLFDTARREELAVVMGARVARLGAAIVRNPGRHYAGRFFATLASLSLGVPVYDTQCGAKVFASCCQLESALARPFRNRWAFDVELLGRLMWPLDPTVPPLELSRFKEVPLNQWIHDEASKFKFKDRLVAGVQPLRIGLEMRRRRGRWTAQRH